MSRSLSLAAGFIAALVLVLSGCGKEGPKTTERVVEVYPDSTPRTVEVLQGDSVIETRHFRTTGSLMRIERGDSVATYLDIHSLDSAYVLQDFLQGRWRSIGIDTTDSAASETYVFDKNSLTFINPFGEQHESIGIQYDSLRTLYTESGTPVTAEIVDVDTVQVTGYTLVREEPLSTDG
ncbi:hypothetical protein [Longibacter salinarum]|nr:hypothetical protein [Longibacter salinarum]